MIAATNKDFEKEIAEGRFREDLYYRLSVIPVHLPPLRERREDIPLLARSFLDRYRKSMSKSVEAIEPKAMERLETYDWPGNVRELENTIERAVALETSRWITMEGLPERITRYYQEHRADLKPVSRDLLVPEGGLDLEQKIGEIERAYLLAALECTGGVRVRASELLKMSLPLVPPLRQETRRLALRLPCHRMPLHTKPILQIALGLPGDASRGALKRESAGDGLRMSTGEPICPSGSGRSDVKCQLSGGVRCFGNDCR